MANKFIFNPITSNFDLVNEGASVSVTDTNSIDLTATGSDLSADLRLSVAAADADNKIVTLDIQTDGLRAQISDENIQDVVGSILTDTVSVDLTYNDGSNQITATVLPAGVDHDQLLNYVVDEHIAHSSIDITAGTGLSGGGNIASDVTINLDIPELTEEPSIADNDYIAIYDTSAATHKKITKQNLTQNIPASQITNVPAGTISATNVQDAINELDTEKIPLTQKGAANGVATLDGGGKVPVAQLPSSIMEYKGVWNASTNTPTLADGIGDIGDVYRVSVAGTQNLGSGSVSYDVGDYIIYNGTIWEKSDTTDAVASVNGQVGIVVLDTDDINEGITNLYFTTERAQDSVGNILSDTSDIDFTYVDATPEITASLTTTGVTANTYGSASVVPVLTVDNKGRLSSVVDTPISITAANVTGFNESAQDAVGNILTDTASVDFIYNDAGNTISADVLPGGVNHNLLLNYVANEHVDHSTVQIATAADSGLAGGGDITATRNLYVDINGTTSETTPAAGDEILIYDVSASALRKMTRSNFLSGIAISSPYDINQTNFVGANNVATPTNVTSFSFPNANVRSFNAEVNVLVDATSDFYEKYTLDAIQRNGDWVMSQEILGDDSGVSFSITSAGQIQYTSSNYAGFVSLNIKFKAKVIEV